MIGIKILEERKSKFNGDIKVARSLGFGTYIQVEGVTQSGGVVYEVWRSILRKVKSQKLKVKSCLILGLGGGSAAKLVRKYWPEAKITGVDIDPVMIELGTRYLALDTSKTKIIIKDALSFCELCTMNYELIIVDLYIGDKVPKKLESERFRSLVYGLLTNSGITVFNRLYFGNKRPEAVRFGQKLQKYFSKVDAFYPEANIMYICS